MTILQDILAAVGWQTRVTENFRSVSPAGLYGINPATTTGLTLGYLGGEFNGVTVANGTVALMASATNYVVANRTTGAVTAATNTTNWLDTTNYMQLYQLVAGTSTFTIAATSDKRQTYGGAAGGGGSFTGGTLTSALNEAPQVALASGATVNIGAAAANTVTVSGTTTITAFDSIATGAIRRVRFLAALTLTHNGTSLILPGSANITTAAGDVATMESLGSGNWRCIDYSRASGAALVGGGGGLSNWTDAVNTATPNATVPVVSLTATNAATNVDAVVSPKGTGSLAAQVADNTTTGGSKRGAYSVDWQMFRSSNSQIASGQTSVIAGGVGNRASGTSSVVSGGNSNSASADYAVALGGQNNQATGQYAVAGGKDNTASGIYSCVLSGNSNSANTDNAVVAGGSGNVASGLFSAIFGGFNATTRGLYGTWAFASGGSQGKAQEQHAVQRITTTSATASGLSANGTTPAATTALVLPNNSAYCFEATVVAKVAGVSDRASFKLTGMVSRGANAAATQIDGTPTVTTVAAIGGASAWSVAAVANTTLGSLEIQVTGAASTTINWVAEVKTIQVVD